MRKSFLKLITPEEFRKVLMDFEGRTDTETVYTTDALGRVPVSDILSPVDLPDFRRSIVDGYGVVSKDTHGASSSIPCYLKLIGEIAVGPAQEGQVLKISPGEAVRVVTGGMVPEGADGVVMVEYTDLVDDTTLEVRRGVSHLENIVLIGEDLKKGDLVVRGGVHLRYFDIGALTGVGITKIDVFNKPRVSVFSTGGEVVEPAEIPKPGQIRDVNKYALAAGVSEAGGIPVIMENVGDDPSSLKEALKKGRETSDMVILSGGSSVGNMDFTLSAIDEIAKSRGSDSPGVLVHGVSIRPGKPTIYGIVDNTPVFGLAGHPVGALIVFLLFVAPMIKLIGGTADPSCKSQIVEARIDRSLSGAPGRDYYVPVRLVPSADGALPTATPLLGKSGMISILTGSTGLICIPSMKEGILKGDTVSVSPL
ncbi:MAG: molybdopterin molybdotransferase MoeA [Deltaproteobacteria bacterium]|uniref:Molybdopterin molybdenumtransferase n=1 Tax=Candidatus Zymogenus saltonus TaxID=2844893 RepID=A0A9D8PNJ4_9DELT|nr:molybdopterin molybdotransferase MoeA [Candidatus Zymogenus saltonus]